jgi:hypothetical protein
LEMDGVGVGIPRCVSVPCGCARALCHQREEKDARHDSAPA